ncbi:MAG: Lrp/AsnC ligand binding domain-containing protein [Candidatus Coatesbacteria bacterium]|nr:Lrp/AsnC ligand binding domain-containing protein [Candidatus Coatesbacteria bacterium]
MNKHKGFVAVNVATGEALNVYNYLKKRPEVTSIYLVAGMYDLMMIIEADSSEVFADFIVQEIQKTKGVTHTMTCMALRGE